MTLSPSLVGEALPSAGRDESLVLSARSPQDSESDSSEDVLCSGNEKSVRRY